MEMIKATSLSFDHTFKAGKNMVVIVTRMGAMLNNLVSYCFC